MKDIIITCITLSLFSGIVKHILRAAGNDKTAHTIQKISGILMILILLGGISKTSAPLSGIPTQNSTEQFEGLQAQTIESIFHSAEAELAKHLEQELTDHFGSAPVACKVLVDRETLRFQKIEIVYSANRYFLSTYEIKKYIYDTYATEAEVIFE